MELIRPFARLGKGDAASAGGKGASLGEMTQAGVPVPPGFVVLANAFERFIEETDVNVEIDAALKIADPENMETIERASERLQALILSKRVPEDISSIILQNYRTLGAEFVAVRSSATAEDSASAAWAGQLDTYLNTTEETLLENVQKCWASLFTPRAIFYRFEKGLHATKISVAVVVQKMVNSDAAGIAFSVHPVTEEYNQLIIEAGWGLGEAVVSGQITPDSYVVTKEPRAILDKNIATKERSLIRANGGVGGNQWIELSAEKGKEQVLADEHILELAQIVVGIERHYGFPVDVEWAMEDGTFYITQSRPITTLAPPVAKEPPEGEPERKIESINATKSVVAFEKTIERDTTFVTQGVWARIMAGENHLQFPTGNPYAPVIIHYVTPDNIQIWENRKAVDWFLNALLEENRKGTAFLNEIAKDQEEVIRAIRPYWEHGALLGADDLKKYLALMERGLTNITFVYYTGMDQRSPRHALAIAEEVRTQDEFFSRNDVFVTEYVKARGYDESLAAVVLADELMTLPDTSALERRRGACVLVGGTELFEEPMREFAQAHPEYRFETLGTDSGGVSEVKGQIAQKGIARGPVRIVRNRGMAQRVREGDILISPMTTPDFLPAMKKAAAFVTDEGGVVCHAAIAARELGKPCVIGTKIATQVLKDGDMVEVDAEKGVVRIINTEVGKTNQHVAPAFVGVLPPEQMRRIKEKNWYRHGIYRDNVLMASFGSPYLGKEYFEREWLARGVTDIIRVDGENYITEDGMASMRDAMLEKLNGEPEYLDRYIAAYEADNDAVLTLSRSIREKDYARATDADIESDFSALAECTKSLSHWLWSLEFLNPAIDRYLLLRMKEWKPEWTDAEIGEFLALLSYVPHTLPFQAELESILALSADSSEREKEIRELHAQYAWRNMYMWDGRPWSLSEYVTRVNGLLRDRAALEKEEEEKKKRIAKGQKFVRQTKDAKMRKLFERLQYLIYLKTYRIDVYTISWYHALNLIDELCRRSGWPYESLLLCTLPEVEHLLTNPAVTEKEAQEREHSALVRLDDRMSYYHGSAAKELKAYLDTVGQANASELRGEIGYKGVVRGTAKVLMSDRDLHKLEKGDILISNLTNPNYNPAFEIIAGVVTDEGGVLCHSAIMAREFSIPCVIGTKYATKQIKDGDMVEVDAEKGVVRIIKRAQK